MAKQGYGIRIGIDGFADGAIDNFKKDLNSELRTIGSNATIEIGHMTLSAGAKTELENAIKNNPLGISVKIDDKDCFFYSKSLNKNGKKEFIGKKVGDVRHVALRKIFENEEEVRKVLKITDHELEEGNQYEYDVKIENIGRITPAELNEEFFKKCVCSVIIFDQLDALVNKADWYPKGGNKAQIIPYAIAKLMSLIPKECDIDWKTIWQKQSIYPSNHQTT